MAKRYLIGLDLGSRFVKAVELCENGGKFELTAFRQVETSGPEKAREAAREVLAGGGFHTKRVATAVSGRSVIVRYVMMNRMPDEELHNVIKFEAGKYIPFEVEDVVLDCQRLEEGNQAETEQAKDMRVLLVAVKRTFVDEHVSVLSDAGLLPAILDVDSFALGNAFELRSRTTGQGPPPDRVIALVDIGAYKTNINILRGGNSYFTREVYIAGNDFTEAVAKKLGCESAEAETQKRNPGEKSAELFDAAASVLDDLCHEVHLSFDYFENQFEKEVEEVYLSGGGSLMPGVEETCQRTFGKPVVRWDPLDGMPIRAKGVDEASLHEGASQLAIAVGLAYRLQG